MAKTPGTPKPKKDAPAQFDMNSRDRKGGGGGGKGGFGGGRGRTEKRAPAQIVVLAPVTVDRGEGWVIQKVGKIDQASHAALRAEYRLTFEGHEALVFDYLGAARDRSKEPAPEKPAEPEPVAAEAEAPEPEAPEPVAEEAAAEPATETEPAAEA